MVLKKDGHTGVHNKILISSVKVNPELDGELRTILCYTFD